jgi:hypothetical protein
LKEFINFGKKFDKNKKDSESLLEFLRKNLLIGEYGDEDPEKCHHPFTIGYIVRLNNSKYLITVCRDCGKLFEIMVRK